MERDEYIETKMRAMKEELEGLKENHPKPGELDSFVDFYKRYLETKGLKKDWSLIKTPKQGIKSYNDLPEIDNKEEILKKLVVIKLNGGLGTTMGLIKPKGSIEVRDGNTFVELVIKQIKHFNKKHRVKIPLLFMTNINTEKDTKQLTKGYKNVKIFNQSMYPRISYDSKLPITGEGLYYPPGHGELFRSLNNSGILDQCIDEGKEYLFVSNIDNIGATIDLKLLNILATSNTDFLLELTSKTLADIKGGTLIDYNGQLEMLEVAMVPTEHKKDFTSLKKFKNFNTNSLWINLNALKRKINDLKLPIIENIKVINDTRVIQLETSIGGALKFFDHPQAVLVDRSRFTPVKTCSDLFLVKSNLYNTENGTLIKNSERTIPTFPKIRLTGFYFNKLGSFIEAFPEIPNIIDLEELVIHGNIKFGRKIILKGTVIIIAEKGQELHIPDGSILEDEIVSGSCIIENLQ